MKSHWAGIRVQGNGSYSKNKIIFMDEVMPNYPWMAQTGRSTGLNYGYRFDRFLRADDFDADGALKTDGEGKPLLPVMSLGSPRPGDALFKDLNGDGKIDGNDRTILGTTRPDWVGGLQINAEWKNIDFSVDVYGEFGSLAHDGRSTSEWANQLGRWNTYKIDYWTPEKPSDRHPRPVEGQSIKYLDATGYYKNSYVNIRNITLGYTLPRAWMGRVVKKTRFYVTMNTPWRYSQFQNTGGTSWWESFYIFGANVQF